VGVGDQPLPPDGGPWLLEVHAHRDAEVVAQLGRSRGEALRVLARCLDVVHAAGADHHQQPIVVAVEHRADLGPAAQHHLGLVVGQRQLLEQVRRRRHRHGALDAQVANLLEIAGGGHGPGKPFRDVFESGCCGTARIGARLASCRLEAAVSWVSRAAGRLCKSPVPVRTPTGARGGAVLEGRLSVPGHLQDL
jgi:hypothetical protein